MINLESLFFFDTSAIVIILVLADLSRTLGNALKIRPYYKLLYLTASLIFGAFLLNVVAGPGRAVTLTISLAIRFIAGITAFSVCLRYWNWLFAEYFKT